jgi:hypothetical protein
MEMAQPFCCFANLTLHSGQISLFQQSLKDKGIFLFLKRQKYLSSRALNSGKWHIHTKEISFFYILKS